MSPGTSLPSDQFLSIVANTPLVSVDLVIVRDGREVLLGMRNNRPAQGSWFVPGGRILKDESREQALERVAQRELGSSMAGLSRRFLGAYEHFYPDCFAGDAGITTHYVVLAFLFEVPPEFEVSLGDDQHEALVWWPVEKALSDASVHGYTRAYLMTD